MRNAAAFEKKEALIRAHPELSTNVAVRPLPAIAPATNAPAATNPLTLTPAPQSVPPPK